ncbi:MAG: ATP-binding domain-containing protein [Bacteroidia bacterium]|jgi:hypothetical protein|nr:ATP-binding domain-containing protein [Bacteroidia bacterium]
MATMIPSIISPEVKSTAERRVFDWFKTAPLTDHWIVLHSLGISMHNKVIYGEADFFVLAPNLGIFALEVKGGRISRKDGIWYYTDKYGKTNSKVRGPFEQAKDAVFSIVNAVKAKRAHDFRYLDNIIFGYGVMFPDIEYNVTGIDEEQWQVFDSRNSRNVREFVLQLSKNTVRKKEALFGPIRKGSLPSRDDIKHLAAILRGDFDFAISLQSHLKYSEEAIINLTKEQFRCLDQIEDNPRCLIQGAAGTGKTLLAVEEAKRAAAQGKKTALFCYNTNLANWIKQHFAEIPQSLNPLFVGTFHSYMHRTVQNNQNLQHILSGEEKSSDFYKEELPIAAVLSLENCNERFDKIIVDEAQDLVSENYLAVLDSCLLKGFERGQWTFYGDFSQQAIYANNLSGFEMIDLLDSKTAFIRFGLTRNCRNTKPICNEIVFLTGFDSKQYHETNIDGPPVNYYTYSSAEEQENKLRGIIHNLLQNRVPPSKITILSPRTRQDSVVSLLENLNIADYGVPVGNAITFCTIHAFKGLENSVIILVDMNSFAMINLLYVGLSRAKTALYIVMSDQAANEYQEMLKRRILNNG